ncbi:hypothetical protein [Psychrobacillus sp. MER TA 171]|uniref:hypothetical protein n=1 Tax=Psychrobacillus sp. MER TA 171 TaxID=2939577 RepID=UPI00203FCF91|nr:hypothetical protein [Psychrobacillus sp. MER TA 171]MCM3358112.1 hypothetical protein [Psychrobacillus sp. MER TA 171]
MNRKLEYFLKIEVNESMEIIEDIITYEPLGDMSRETFIKNNLNSICPSFATFFDSVNILFDGYAFMMVNTPIIELTIDNFHRDIVGTFLIAKTFDQRKNQNAIGFSSEKELLKSKDKLNIKYRYVGEMRDIFI